MTFKEYLDKCNSGIIKLDAEKLYLLNMHFDYLNKSIKLINEEYIQDSSLELSINSSEK